jgi:DNA-binding PadR family transcriptional regulator
MSEHVAKGSQKVELRSTLGWPLLGLLIERPSYGYELARRFERIYGDEIRLGGDVRIYEVLDTLSSKALIEELASEEVHDAPERQPKLRYRATAAGVRAYKEWLVAQFEEERRRSRLFARQLAMLEPEAALVVIERYERECLKEAGELAASEPDGVSASGIAERLAHEDERLALGVRLSWLEYARIQLKSLIAEHAGER